MAAILSRPQCVKYVLASAYSRLIYTTSYFSFYKRDASGESLDCTVINRMAQSFGLARIIFIHVYVCVYMYIYAYTCMCMYICIYICMYTMMRHLTLRCTPGPACLVSHRVYIAIMFDKAFLNPDPSSVGTGHADYRFIYASLFMLCIMHMPVVVHATMSACMHT